MIRREEDGIGLDDSTRTKKKVKERDGERERERNVAVTPSSINGLRLHNKVPKLGK